MEGEESESEEKGEEAEEGEKGDQEGEADEEEGNDSGKEKSRTSVETEVLSEERTEVVGSGDEKEGEEVDQPEEGEEQEILVSDDATRDDERTMTRRTRTSKRITEILAAKSNKGKEIETPETDEEDREEIPLRRRPRSERANVIDKSPVKEVEEHETVQTDPEEMDTKDEVAEKRARLERKRKGKQIASQPKKKAKQTALDVTPKKPIQVPYESAEDNSSDEEVERETEEGAVRRQEDPPHYKKLFVKINKRLFEQMGKFKDPRQQQECRKRVSEGKKVKSGKMVHMPSLQDLGAEEKFMSYIKGIGFEWLLEQDMSEVPVDFAKEFFTSFRFKTTTDLNQISISFRYTTET